MLSGLKLQKGDINVIIKDFNSIIIKEAKDAPMDPGTIINFSGPINFSIDRKPRKHQTVCKVTDFI